MQICNNSFMVVLDEVQSPHVPCTNRIVKSINMYVELTINLI